MGDVTPPSATAKSIPVVDFSPFRVQEGVLVGDPATPGQLQVASEIDKVCREHGFLCLTGFGMSATQRDEVFAASRTLFALSDEDKGELARISPATNTGYAPFRSESLNRSRPAELKEAFNLRFPPKKVNDLSGCPPGYADVTTYVLGFYKDLAHRYGLACALALGLPVDFFTSTLAHYDLCTARMLHYPPCNWKDTATGDSSGDVSKPVRIGEHTDFGAYTFLMVSPDHGPDGLQIKPVQGGEVGGKAGGEAEGWQDVTLPPLGRDTPVMIVNTGALMARWTNDEWNATAHRVIVTDEVAAARSRYSVACFIDPDNESLVQSHTNFGEPKYEPITSNDYLKEKLESMMKKG